MNEILERKPSISSDTCLTCNPALTENRGLLNTTAHTLFPEITINVKAGPVERSPLARKRETTPADIHIYYIHLGSVAKDSDIPSQVSEHNMFI